MGALVLHDEQACRRLALSFHTGQRYRAVLADASLRPLFLAKLAEAGSIAVVAGHGGLIGNLRVGENLLLPLAYRGAPVLAELEQRAAALLAELGLMGERAREFCAAFPDRLSAFERRLAAFVRAMLGEPDVVVYDHLFAGLDPLEAEKAAGFDRVFQTRFPFRTAVYLEAG